jgi:acetyltransferase-like isoleucine patch superfamily enzyme
MRHLLYLFLRWCPGALGILLRQKLYRHLLKAYGRNVLIGRYVDLKNPRGIIIGDDVVLNEYACLDAGRSSDLSEAAIVLGKGVFIGAGTTLLAGPGRLIIEEGNNIGSGCSIVAYGETLLEHHALLAGFCTVGATAPATELDVPDSPAKIPTAGRTRLGSGCWLGLRSRVASGIEIGEGTIVGAHSTVNESLPDYVIAFGQPARVWQMRP